MTSYKKRVIMLVSLWGSILKGKFLFAMSLEMIVRICLYSLTGKTLKSHIKDGGASPPFSTKNSTL